MPPQEQALERAGRAINGSVSDRAEVLDLRDILGALQAVRDGDFSVRLPGDKIGIAGKVADTFNEIVGTSERLATELERAGRTVGKEGRTRHRVALDRRPGAWGAMESSVNALIEDLLWPTAEITRAIAAVAKGDLTRSMPLAVDGRTLEGEFLRSASIVNTMIGQMRAFTSEVTRVAREVGTEGKLGGQAVVRGAAGTWKDLTDSVNAMATNLTGQVRNIAEVTTAVARGDLSRKITVDVKGEILELKETINTMVDQLNSFAAEVTRVAREVGTEGELGGQAIVPGVAGTWKDLTDSVNAMATNLTGQVRNIAGVTTAVARGDLSRKITVDVKGEILELKDTINTMVDQLNSFAAEVTRVAREVGTEGKLGGQAAVPGAAGTWKDLTDNVNSMAGNLTGQVRNIAEVATAIARGDLSRKITVDVKGEILELKDTINTMVDQLNSFAAEVTRVAREVGTEGELGGQAIVPGAAGTWKDLTDNVNSMAGNLTGQVRNIAEVATAIARGDLSHKITADVKGEILELKNTINTMVDQLNSFAAEVTRVAREVGVEGRLGGQAHVPGAAGTWKDLTANVNLLAANLTTQVRAIAEVATAVTQGDLTRSIQVEARGEVSELKDNINAMIGNLRVTTERNTEQDWLKTNIAKFSRMMQGQRDLTAVGKLLLSELAPLVNAHQGVMYVIEGANGAAHLKELASYADGPHEMGPPRQFAIGEGLIGQAAADRRKLFIADIQADSFGVRGGLIAARPRNVIVLPALFEGEVKAVLELASLQEFTSSQLGFLEQLTDSVGVVLNTIEATMRTEELLKQSQQLAGELQTQQRELQQTNGELANKALLLAEQKAEVERKNQEVELARHALEEKAAELALTSRYKSEFLANMSHELRTPLNSILILGQQLSQNNDGNLAPRQIEFARTIHSAGTDLLNLITDILDLSKIESGTVTVQYEELPFATLRETIVRSFRHEAEGRKLAFTAELDPRLPVSMTTDSKRLLQVLKNLLSNAFKFTERGGVRLHVAPANGGWNPDHPMLSASASVIEFAVTDTGIGIPLEKQRIIFEAFQQADAGTARKYGGTGLGLAISRELAQLLGGEIRLISMPGRGSTFTLYLPLGRPDEVGAGLVGGVGTDRVRALAFQSDEIPAYLHASADEPRGEETDPDGALRGRKVLVVDDDVRNAFALNSVLERQQMQVINASNGQEAIDLIERIEDLSLVLMDVMMPEIDGYETMRRIRRKPRFSRLPIIAITAKAMQGDREKCLEAGASEYLAKPVNTDQLLSLVRTLLHR
jgi:signal transduction histidine kinase/HAMP domain-containing protein/CheY-like chemotaxis protein